jgi:hypothetical protein
VVFEINEARLRMQRISAGNNYYNFALPVLRGRIGNMKTIISLSIISLAVIVCALTMRGVIVDVNVSVLVEVGK